MNAKIQAVEILNIKGEKQLYITIETTKGKAHVSVGEKNFKLIKELTEDQKETTKK